MADVINKGNHHGFICHGKNVCNVPKCLESHHMVVNSCIELEHPQEPATFAWTAGYCNQFDHVFFHGLTHAQSLGHTIGMARVSWTARPPSGRGSPRVDLDSFVSIRILEVLYIYIHWLCMVIHWYNICIYIGYISVIWDALMFES